jgi:hypothetical protein
MRYVLVAALVLGALTVAPSAGATNECRGLNPCVPVAGPWVVVPTGTGVPRPEVQYQLTCPRGYVVGGVDAELSDGAIDLSYLASSGAPVSPGVTTSQTVVFVGAYVGTAPRAPTFRPHAGCIPASGGGARTPTGVRAVVPPGHPTVRRVATVRVQDRRTVVQTCHADERLVAWYVARGFATPGPPTAARVRTLTASASRHGNVVDVSARGRGIVQVSVVCAGGK